MAEILSEGIETVDLSPIALATRLVKLIAISGSDTGTLTVGQVLDLLLGLPPGALDTIEELADALGNDPDFAATMMTLLAAKAPLSSPLFTGIPQAPTAAPGTNTTQLATTAFVLENGGAVALSASVATTSGAQIDLTGIPSNAKRITVICDGVSAGGTAGFGLQPGTSGGIETTGYVSAMSSVQGTNNTLIASSTTRFLGVNASVAASAYYGSFVLEKISGNLWSCSSLLAVTTGATWHQRGSKLLGGTLDRVRLLANGDAFDLGTVTIMVEV